MSLDTIDWSQFGPLGTQHADGVAGVTVNGVTFTISGPSPANDGLRAMVQGLGTFLTFATSAPLLYDTPSFLLNPFYTNPGAITIVFGTPIRGITAIAVCPNLLTVFPAGPYTAHMSIYNGVTLLAIQTYSDPSVYDPGTIPSFDYDAGSAIITKLVFTVTGTSQAQPYDNRGIFIGSSPNAAGFGPINQGHVVRSRSL